MGVMAKVGAEVREEVRVPPSLTSLLGEGKVCLAPRTAWPRSPEVLLERVVAQVATATRHAAPCMLDNTQLQSQAPLPQLLKRWQ